MKKILIIEDDIALGDILLQKMQSSGYQAELVREGVKGFERMVELMPDLILLDLFLPVLNGFEILAQKNSNSQISDIPVIVLTNSFHPVNGTEIEKLGVTDFLVKSNTTPEKIAERVHDILEKIAANNAMGNAKGDSSSNHYDALSGKRVLIVEDDDFLGKIISSRLASRGVVAVLAKSGEDAVIELKKQKFDAALLDILLPGISGFDVLQFIREVPETEKLPVTVISNFNQVKDEEKAKSFGAAFMVKALVNPDDIVSQVEKMIK